VVPMPTLSVNNGSICSGNSTVMTVSGASVTVWNPGNLAGATQTLSPMITTVYTVTGNNATCSDTKTLTLNVTSTPTVSAPSGAMCSGNATVITASGAQGYTWSPGSLAGASQTLNPQSTQVYTVTGSNGNCTGAPRQLTLTINPTPSVAVSGASICSGSSAVITASGASVYTWQPGIMTGSTQTLSPMVTAIYTVTGATGACTSQPAFFAIDVTVQPTVTATSATICAGETATLSATGASGYTWTTGSSSPGTTVSPAATTVYSVTGATGICKHTATVSILVKPLPVFSVSTGIPPIICLGESLTLTASGAQGYTFQPGAPTGSAVSVSPSASIVYTVTGESNGCTDERTFAVAVEPCTAVNELNTPAPLLYPQPVSGALHIRFAGQFSGEWRLYNAIGQLLKEKPESDKAEITLDMSSYPAGIYVIRISSRSGEEYDLKAVRE
jgi:trimeric autotransporter adhesin